MRPNSPPYPISVSAVGPADTSSVAAADTSSAAGPEDSRILLVVVDSPAVGSHPAADSPVVGILLAADSRLDVVEDTLRIRVLAARLGCSSLSLRRRLLGVAVGGGWCCRRACS